MARIPKHAPAPSPLHGAAMIRSLYAHLSEGLVRLPRIGAGWLPRSAPAWLRQVIAALLRLLGAGGPAQAAAAPTTGKKAPRRGGKAPAVPGTQGGDADEGEIPAASDPAPGGNDAAVLGGDGAPRGKKAPRRRGKVPAGTGPQGGNGGEGPRPAATDSALGGNDAAALGGAGAPTAKKARRRPGEAPTGPRPQGGNGGEGAFPAASGSAPGGNDAAAPGGDGAPSGKMARHRPGKAPAVPGPQGGDAGEGACSAAPDFVPGGNDAAAQKPEPAVKNFPDPGTKEPHQKQEEAEGSSHASPDEPPWEVVKGRKGCRGGPNLGAETMKLPQVKCCTYCLAKGHRAKDCPRTKAIINLSTVCDPRGKGHCRKAKDVDEDNYNLKKQRFAEDEEEAERKAHRMYDDNCNYKKDHILCLACHLKGKEVSVKKDYDVMKTHFKEKHGCPGKACEKKGCLARAETKHDIGRHQYICHGI